jgi:hypothetical protein
LNAEMGEFLVGAYLKVIEKCDFIGYNMRPPGGGLKGLAELDVVGLKFETETAFLCEVTTHIGGLLYKTNQYTIEHIKKKHAAQRSYAGAQLSQFKVLKYQFWSPAVPKGYLTDNLPLIDDDLEIIVNEEYAARIGQLRMKAQELTNDEGNPAFRLLQILEHMRPEKVK